MCRNKRQSLFALCSIFGSSVALAKSEDFVSQVHLQVESEIAERLDISTDDVTVHYLGMGSVHRCDGASHVKVDIPAQEDFRGKTLLYIEGWKADVQCGRWTVQGDVEIWGQNPTAQNAAQAGEVVEVQWTRGRLDQIREPLFEFTPSMTNATLQAIVPIADGAPLNRNHVRRKRFSAGSIRSRFSAKRRATGEGSGELTQECVYW